MRYYFFFSDNRASLVWRCLRPGFRHVEMITDLDNGQIMHINPRLGRVDYGLTNEHTLAEVIEQLKALGRTVVMYCCNAPDAGASIPRGWLMTCASYLAYSIGLPFRGATPYQLYVTLKARGGVDV